MTALLFARYVKVNNVMSGQLCDPARYAAMLSTTIFGLRNWVCVLSARICIGLTSTTTTNARGVVNLICQRQ